MDIFTEIRKRELDGDIPTFLDNGVKIFHIEFRNPTDIIRLTSGGEVNSPEDFEQATHGNVDYAEYYHAHDCYFIVCVLKGKNFEIVEDVPTLMSENDLLMITPYTRHHNLYAPPSEVVFIHIQPALLFQILVPSIMENVQFSDFFSEFLADRYVRKSLFFKDCMADVGPIIQRIITEYLEEKPLYQSSIQYMLGELIIELARSKQPMQKHFSNSERDEMEDLLAYITKHYQDISLSQVSAHYGYAPAYLSRKIREYTGKTYSQLITNYKLNRALILIREQRLSIEEIAYACGYKEISTFYKAFKKQFHCAPKDMLQNP